MSSLLLITNLVALVAIAVLIFFNQSEATGLGLNMQKKTSNNFFINKKGDSFFYKSIFALAGAVAVMVLLSGKLLNREYGKEQFIQKVEQSTQKTEKEKETPSNVIEGIE